MSHDDPMHTSSLHTSPEPFHGESDIVERLRAKAGQIGPAPDTLLAFMTGIRPLILESAAEIERLRREKDEHFKSYNLAITARLEWRRIAEENERRALTAESLLAAAWEALKPFVDAYEAAGYGGGAPDYFDIWESTAAISITFGDLRKAAALRAAGKEVSERNSTQKDGSR